MFYFLREVFSMLRELLVCIKNGTTRKQLEYKKLFWSQEAFQEIRNIIDKALKAPKFFVMFVLLAIAASALVGLATFIWLALIMWITSLGVMDFKMMPVFSLMYLFLLERYINMVYRKTTRMLV